MLEIVHEKRQLSRNLHTTKILATSSKTTKLLETSQIISFLELLTAPTAMVVFLPYTTHTLTHTTPSLLQSERHCYPSARIQHWRSKSLPVSALMICAKQQSATGYSTRALWSMEQAWKWPLFGSIRNNINIKEQVANVTCCLRTKGARSKTVITKTQCKFGSFILSYLLQSLSYLLQSAKQAPSRALSLSVLKFA